MTMAMMMIAVVIVVTVFCDTVIAVSMVVFTAIAVVSYIAFSQIAAMLLVAFASGRTAALVPCTLIASINNKRQAAQVAANTSERICLSGAMHHGYKKQAAR
jgi:hypothetical protein